MIAARVQISKTSCQPDGSFKIDQTTFYGKIFGWVVASKRDYGESLQTSYCRAFWITNWHVFAGALVTISAVVLIAAIIASFSLGVLLMMVYWILVVCAIVGLCYGVYRFVFEPLSQKLDESQTGQLVKKLSNAPWEAIGIGLLLVGAIGVCWLIYTNWKIVGAAAAVVLIACVLLRLAFRAFDELRHTQFGQDFGGFYYTYLCPRIKYDRK